MLGKQIEFETVVYTVTEWNPVDNVVRLAPENTELADRLRNVWLTNRRMIYIPWFDRYYFPKLATDPEIA